MSEEEPQKQQLESLERANKYLTRDNKIMRASGNKNKRKLTEEIMTLRYEGDTKDRTIATLEQRLREAGL